jgi:hypothetical protein
MQGHGFVSLHQPAVLLVHLASHLAHFEGLSFPTCHRTHHLLHMYVPVLLYHQFLVAFSAALFNKLVDAQVCKGADSGEPRVGLA